MPETEITAWLASPQDAMIALLREMVDIDSGSYNKPGTDAVGSVVRRFLESRGLTVEAIPQDRHGDCLRASIPDQASGNVGGNITLMGHRDTVFPDGETTRHPFTIRDGIASGASASPTWRPA
jgi:glutamate carboxypeptidase